MELCTVIWWNEENKSKKEGHPSIHQGVEDLVHTRNRQLAKAAGLLSFL